MRVFDQKTRHTHQVTTTQQYGCGVQLVAQLLQVFRCVTFRHFLTFFRDGWSHISELVNYNNSGFLDSVFLFRLFPWSWFIWPYQANLEPVKSFYHRILFSELFLFFPASKSVQNNGGSESNGHCKANIAERG